MIDPAAILALLAFGPHSRDAIAIELAAPTHLVKRALWRLVRAGHVKRTGGTKYYALPSYVAKNGRPPVPNHQRRPPASGQAYKLCAACQLKHAKHGGLCRACARAAGVYTLTSLEADRQRQARQYVRDGVPVPAAAVGGVQALRPALPAVSRVVDGVEYQVVDYEALLQRDAERWPSRGSSLTSPFFDRARLKSELRRGAHS